MRALKYLVRVAVHLLIGAVVHTVIYGAPIWDTVWTWAIIVFWPLVLLLWALALVGATAAACLVAVMCWLWFDHASNSYRRWRARRARCAP